MRGCGGGVVGGEVGGEVGRGGEGGDVAVGGCGEVGLGWWLAVLRWRLRVVVCGWRWLLCMREWECLWLCLEVIGLGGLGLGLRVGS